MKLTRPQSVFRSILLFSFLLTGTVSAKPWKSAEMITQQNFKYGAFEARIRGAEGSGMITAFFLYKNGSEWAGAEWQEQDFELFGKNGGFQTQVMTPGDPRTENVTNHRAAANIWERYYTYRMEWTPTALSFYVDGKLVRRETDAVRYAKLLDPARAEPMNLRLSLWAGDFEWSGAFDESMVPASVDVNWAQISAYTPGAGLNGSDFTPLWRDDFNTIDYSRWYFANWTFDFAVNDYTPGGARTDNGYLQLKLTHWSQEGRQFTTSPIDDGLLMPPEDDADPTDPGDGDGNGGDPGTPVLGEPVVLPGKVFAIQPSAFLDLTPGNHGDASCIEGDLDAARGSDGVCYVAGIWAGEWIEYDVLAPSAGDWTISAKFATGEGERRFRVELDGQPISDPILVPSVGWEQFSSIEIPSVGMAAGPHKIRFVFLTSDINFHSFDVSGGGTSMQPPGPVSSLTAVAGVQSIALQWAAIEGATSYDLQRGPVGGPYLTVGNVSATSWVDVSLTPGTTYSYVVVARNAAGSTLPSPSASAIPLAPIVVDVPSALVAFSGASKVDLTWAAGSNNVSFRVYRSLDGVSFTLIGSPVSASFTDLSVVAGTGYTYRVTGILDSRESVPSAVVSATPVGLPPATVSNLAAIAGDRQVSLSWQTSVGAATYKVYRSTTGSAPVLVATVSTTSWVNSSLENGTTYQFYVSAANEWGDAPASSIVTATPMLPVASVKAQYRAGTTGTTNGIRPLLRLVNTGDAAIPLSELTIRYWFTNEGGRPQSYWCDWAQVGNSNITSSFVAVSPARTGADTYLQLGFRATAGNLAAGASTGEIQSRFSKTDWSNYDQSNDASYDGSLATSYADWSKVTVYRNGVLIWGQEP